ncbi:hypothetical protein MMPV_000469 [Pyropia vietnamensis]
MFQLPPPPPLQLLSAAQRLRANSAPDTEYYTHPRLLPAVTPAYAARLASLYASVLSGGEVVLELGASWDSYLPPAGPPPAAVMGLGLNAVEMGRNAALTAWVVKDLNAAPGAEARDEDVGGGVEAAAAAADAAVAGGGDVVAAAMAAASAAAVSTAERTADGRVVPPSALDSVHPDGAVSRLPWPSASYDAVLCNATVAYLARPEGVFAEVGRLLAPGGVAVFAWSDALFFDKAIAGWMAADPPGRLSLVKKYLSVGAGLEVVQTVAVGAPREAAVTHRQMQALGREAAAEEPFYAVVARKPGGGGGL